MFEKAKNKKIHTLEQIENEIERLISHPRARRGLGDFVELWTGSYKISSAQKSATYNELFTEDLKRESLKETINFFVDSVQNGKDFSTLFLADYSFGTKRLADFYGVKPINDKMIDLSNTNRRGLLSRMQAF